MKTIIMIAIHQHHHQIERLYKNILKHKKDYILLYVHYLHYFYEVVEQMYGYYMHQILHEYYIIIQCLVVYQHYFIHLLLIILVMIKYINFILFIIDKL